MNTADPDSPVTPVPSARQRSRWRRVLAVGLWGLISLGIVVALAWQWINWSGARRLAAAKAKVEAAGITMDWREWLQSLPEPPPDELNFCAVPALKDLARVVRFDSFGGEPSPKHARLINLLPRGEWNGPPRPAWPELGKPLNAMDWLDWLGVKPELAESPAECLLRTLEQDLELEEELAAALDRPFAQWTPSWKERELPDVPWEVHRADFVPAAHAALYWSLRSAAAMQAGDIVIAYRCVAIALRFAEAFHQESSFYSFSFISTLSGGISNAVWELCRARACSEEDFIWLESALVHIDTRSILSKIFENLMCFRYESVNLIKYYGGNHLRLYGYEKFPTGYKLFNFYPHGWIDANSASLIDFYLNHGIFPSHDQTLTFWDFWNQHVRAQERMSRKPWSTEAITWFMSRDFGVNRPSFSQAQCDMALLACALERHALQHGEYPESLDALRFADGVPTPKDPITGKSYRYQRTENGRYRLWSPGHDGKDDHGQRNLNPAISKPYHHWYRGDWVWDYPEQ